MPPLFSLPRPPTATLDPTPDRPVAHRGWELVLDFASKAAAERRRLRGRAREPRPAATRRGAGTELAKQCRSQRVLRQAAKQNFNLVAIILVLAIGSLIIGLGLTVDSCVGSCQRRWKKGVERQQQWLHDGTLQLQRFAYEGRGFDGRMDVDENIPTLDATQKLPRFAGVVQNGNGHAHPDGGVDGYQLADMNRRG